MADKRSLTNLGYCLKVNERLSAMSRGSEELQPLQQVVVIPRDENRQLE